MRFLTCTLASLFLLFALAFTNNAQAAGHKPAKGHKAARKVAVAKPRKAAAKALAVSTTSAVALPAAPKLVTITGIVLGQNGLALPGASVFPTGKFQAAVVTNEEGEFSLTLPAAQAAASLTFAYAGLGDWQVRLKGRSQRAPLFVTLLPKGL